MALFSPAKKEKSEKAKSRVKKDPVVKAAAAQKKAVNFKSQAVKKEFTQAYRLLKKPLVTEKTVNLSSNLNQYAFAVADGATKNEIKKIVQDLYGVKVLRVNMLNTSGKKRRVGRHEGFKPGFKKAIVFLNKEDKIEVISR